MGTGNGVSDPISSTSSLTKDASFIVQQNNPSSRNSVSNRVEGGWVTDIDDITSENYSTVMLTLPDGNDIPESRLIDLQKSGGGRQAMIGMEDSGRLSG